MDVAPILFWLHIGFAFAFVLAHGVSLFVSLRLAKERDPARLGALLDLSLSSVKVASLMLLLTILTGVLATFVGEAGAGDGCGPRSASSCSSGAGWRSAGSAGSMPSVTRSGKEGFHEKAAKAAHPRPISRPCSTRRGPWSWPWSGSSVWRSSSG